MLTCCRYRNWKSEMYRNLFSLALVALLGFAQRTDATVDHLTIDRVRGIALHLKAFYDPNEDFRCIDNSMSLPFSYVNDDYCDCPDGSDEPGTSACPRGVFHCINLMHAPRDIPSSRVNDGICDCCDGSDEYDSPTSCPNTCEFLGRAAREEAKRREELISEGSKLRADMVNDGQQRVSEAKQKVEELRKKVETAKLEKETRELQRKTAEDAERALLDAEAKLKEETEQKDAPEVNEEEKFNKMLEEDKYQAEEAFNDLDTNEDGIVTYQELMNLNQFDQNKDGSVSIDEAKFFLAYREEVDLEEFTSTSWPLIKPLWRVTGSSTFPPVEKDDIHDEDYQDDEVEDPKPATESEKERDPAVKAAVEAADKARMEYHESERKHKDTEQELEKYEQIATGDFGENSEFAPLRGECFELAVKEYIYKMCPFDKTSQRNKDGGSETSLGRWARWEENPPHKHAAMKFEGGTGCWNGPARTTLVVLQCGLRNQLMSATEPSRCEYLFEFATPAACVPGMPVAKHMPVEPSGTEHDEL